MWWQGYFKKAVGALYPLQSLKNVTGFSDFFFKSLLWKDSKTIHNNNNNENRNNNDNIAGVMKIMIIVINSNSNIDSNISTISNISYNNNDKDIIKNDTSNNKKVNSN